MGAVPSSQYDQQRRRSHTTWKLTGDKKTKREEWASRRRMTYAATTTTTTSTSTTNTKAKTPIESDYITPYDLRKMMERMTSLDDALVFDDTASTPSTPESVECPVLNPNGMVPLTAKLSVVSNDSGLESEGGMSPRRVKEEDEGKERYKKEKKKGNKLSRKARKLSERFRSKSFTSLFSTSDKPAPLFGNSLLNREWEIVTVQEMCRRLSLDHLDVQDMPIPEGANSSVILDELMIRQIMEILPARAEGYPWVNIYNSEKHGFSLATLYRKMVEFDEDMSPVLLIIRDTKDHVFGCVVSSAIRPSDHFIGTGDSCLLWRFTGEVPHTRELRHYSWTGENQFFVHAQKDCLSIGAGHGHNGLWMDADLNHGRSQRCDTFDNEPLSGESEDFIIQFVEAYGFRI